MSVHHDDRSWVETTAPQGVPATTVAPAAAPVPGTARRWTHAPGVVARRTMQGLMVLPPGGSAVVFPAPAAALWEVVARPAAREQVEAKLLASGAAADAAEVADAIDALAAGGAIREVR